ncbi:MAG: deoxyribonuclease IV [Candidatus Nanohaloarchaea archaeon]
MNLKVGAHVSVAGGAQKAFERQEEVGGNCGQIFAGSPRTWSVKEYSEKEASKFRESQEEYGQAPYVIHSTYLVNLATPKDDLLEKSKNCIQKELYAAEQLGIEYVVFHPGAHTGSGREAGIDTITSAVDDLDIPKSVTLLFENTAGKGTTLGKSFGELRQMVEATEQENVGVCIDTCHAHAAGYNLSDEQGFEDMMQEIREDLGLENVEVLHLNDSKDELGSEKDNHEHIGEGNIGEEGFSNIVNSEDFEDLPMMLETPNTDEKGYKENIERIKALRN